MQQKYMPLLIALATLLVLPLRAARRRADAHHRDRRGDLRHRLHGAEHPGRPHRPRLVRPRRVLRPCRLCGGAVAAPLVSRRHRDPVAVRDRVRRAVRLARRLPHPAPPRRLFLAADARALRHAVHHRVPLDRGDRRRKRARRRGASRRCSASISADPWTYYGAGRGDRPCGRYLLWRFHRSPVGHVLVAIRENEQRARFIGYPTDRYKLFAFTISAAITGLAGVLSVFHHRFASAEPISVRVLRRAAGDGGDRRHALVPRAGARRAVLHSVPRIPLDLDRRTGCCTSACCSSASSCSRRPGWSASPSRCSRRSASASIEAAAMAGARSLGRTRRSPTRSPSARATDGPVLIARELAKSFGGIRAVAGADIVVDEPHAACADRPERRRQDHGVQPCVRHVPARRAASSPSPTSRSPASRPEDITRAGVGRSFQITNLFGGLTVEENVRLAVQARHAKRFAWWTSADGIADDQCRDDGVHAPISASTAWSAPRPPRSPMAGSACSTWASRSRPRRTSCCSTSRSPGSRRPSARASPRW